MKTAVRLKAAELRVMLDECRKRIKIFGSEAEFWTPVMVQLTQHISYLEERCLDQEREIRSYKQIDLAKTMGPVNHGSTQDFNATERTNRGELAWNAFQSEEALTQYMTWVEPKKFRDELVRVANNWAQENGKPFVK